MIEMFILNFFIYYSFAIQYSINLNTYREILNDIKQSQEFKEYVMSFDENCEGISVSPYLYSLCTMGCEFFIDTTIQNYINQKCTNVAIAFKTEKYNDLIKLSDREHTCFLAYFSFKVKDRIAVKIVYKDRSAYGGRSIVFLYKIQDGGISKLENIEIIQD